MVLRCGLKIPSQGLLFGITGLAEWCRTVNPSDGIFNSHRTTIMDSFYFWHTFPSTIAFKLEYALFYQFYAKITVFFFHKEMFSSTPKTLTSKHLAKKNMSKPDFVTSKTDNMTSKGWPDIVHESCLTPPHVRGHFLALVGSWKFWSVRQKNCIL